MGLSVSIKKWRRCLCRAQEGVQKCLWHEVEIGNASKIVQLATEVISEATKIMDFLVFGNSLRYLSECMKGIIYISFKALSNSIDVVTFQYLINIMQAFSFLFFYLLALQIEAVNWMSDSAA